MDSIFSLRTFLVLAVLITLSACSEPPTDELMQAEAAIQAAQAEGAEDYVADDYRAASDALSDAKSKTESRDYDAAKSSALEAKMKADIAKTKVVAEKLKLRGELESTLTGMGQEWDDLMTTAGKKRLSRAARTSLADTRKSYAALITDVQDHAAAEDYIGAMQILREARATATGVRELISSE
ncbi:MAG: DUF4398 domain-containing protein [Candidatus Latescibacteria bacterium]|nr:DUF4398 domain-containing protein [Candidatus Latescibacterota bacterium]